LHNQHLHFVTKFNLPWVRFGQNFGFERGPGRKPIAHEKSPPPVKAAGPIRHNHFASMLWASVESNTGLCKVVHGSKFISSSNLGHQGLSICEPGITETRPDCQNAPPFDVTHVWNFA
jgi:hypothetical protein